jgi:hypothetical protein
MRLKHLVDSFLPPAAIRGLLLAFADAIAAAFD